MITAHCEGETLLAPHLLDYELASLVTLDRELAAANRVLRGEPG